jgi:hypothetical protein
MSVLTLLRIYLSSWLKRFEHISVDY